MLTPPGVGRAGGDLAVAITSPSGSRIKAHVVPTAEGFLVNFTPTELGEYLLSVSLGGEAVAPPRRLTCLAGSDAGRVRAAGPGLLGGVVNKPAEFIIDTRAAGQGGLGVTVEGPCEAAINCRDNGDGTCAVAYLPTELGDYSINITFNDQHIPGSPFQAVVGSEQELQRIKVSGTGIQPHGTATAAGRAMQCVTTTTTSRMRSRSRSGRRGSSVLQTRSEVQTITRVTREA